MYRCLKPVSEEKFDNVKNSSVFPMKAIDYILDKYQKKILSIVV